MVHEINAVARRGRPRELRAESIIDAAIAIVTTEGLESLTLQRVAKDVHCVPAALYRYFSSKDALLAAMQRRVVSDIGQALTQTLDQWEHHSRLPEAPRSLGTILCMARFYVSLPQTMPTSYLLAAILLNDPRRLLPHEEILPMIPILTSLVGQVTGAISQATSANALSEGALDARTQIIWSSLHGVLVLAKTFRIANQELNVQELGIQSALTLLRGWGADETHLTAALRAVERFNSTTAA